MPARAKQPGQSSIQIRPVALEVKTIVIDGKKITPGFLAQIQRQNLIDEETGEVVGMPLGLVNIHRKDTCPLEEHWHVLWITERGELRQAVVTDSLTSEAYRERRRESENYGERLTDLLALLLARQQRAPDLAPPMLLFSARRAVTFSDGTQLQISSGGDDDAYEQIVHLEAARTALVQAMEAQEDQAPSLVTQTLPQANLSTPALKAALRLQQELARQNIVLAHPTLYKTVRNEAPLHLAEFRSGREHIHHSRYVEENWLVFDVAYHERRRADWLLFWRSSAHSTDQITDEEVTRVEEQLRPHIGAFRVLLADQAVRAHLKHLEQTARKLLPKKQPLSLAAGATLPSPQAIQKALHEEQQRFRAYTSRWQHSLLELQKLEQIYIL